MSKSDILRVLAILACCIILRQSVMCQTTSILAAAETRVQFFLNAIPAGQESSYGFQTRLEFSGVRFGNPYEVYTLDLQQISRSSSTKNVEMLSVNEWRVPIKVGDAPRALLTVSKINGTWRAVDFGAATLARELAQYESRTKLEPSSLLGILRLYDLDIDLLLVRNGNSGKEVTTLIPLKSARDAFLLTGIMLNEQYSLQEFVPIVMALYSSRSNAQH